MNERETGVTVLGVRVDEFKHLRSATQNNKQWTSKVKKRVHGRVEVLKMSYWGLL